MEKFILTILSPIIERYISKRMCVQISVKACLVKMRIPKSDSVKIDRIAKWISLTFINRNIHPIRIYKIVAFYYQNRVKKFFRKSDKLPINITRRDLFPIRLESSQTYSACFTNTDFCSNIPAKGLLLFKIYFTHSDKPIRKLLDLSREKIEYVSGSLIERN